MTIETGIENTGVYIDALDDTYPADGDDLVEGDNHIRGIKNVTLNTWPNITGAVTSTHTELNILDGVTATTAEINYLDKASALGTSEASKVVTTDASRDITNLNSVTSTAFAGDLTGNVIGNLTGDVTGDINGAVVSSSITLNGQTVNEVVTGSTTILSVAHNSYGTSSVTHGFGNVAVDCGAIVNTSGILHLQDVFCAAEFSGAHHYQHIFGFGGAVGTVSYSIAAVVNGNIQFIAVNNSGSTQDYTIYWWARAQ